MSIPQRELFEREKKMYNQLYQGMGNEIQHQFKQFRTSRSMWIALKERFFGNSEMIAGKQSLLRKEFEIFMAYKNESLNDMITRFCHLLAEMDEYAVQITESDKVLKLADGLPQIWDSFIMVLKQTLKFESLTVTDLIGKLPAQEMNMRKRKKCTHNHSHYNKIRICTWVTKILLEI